MTGMCSSSASAMAVRPWCVRVMTCPRLVDSFRRYILLSRAAWYARGLSHYKHWSEDSALFQWLLTVAYIIWKLNRFNQIKSSVLWQVVLLYVLSCQCSASRCTSWRCIRRLEGISVSPNRSLTQVHATSLAKLIIAPRQTNLNTTVDFEKMIIYGENIESS